MLAHSDGDVVVCCRFCESWSRVGLEPVLEFNPTVLPCFLDPLKAYCEQMVGRIEAKSMRTRNGENAKYRVLSITSDCAS